MRARICDKFVMIEKTIAQDFSQGADSLTWPGMLDTWMKKIEGSVLLEWFDVEQFIYFTVIL